MMRFKILTLIVCCLSIFCLLTACGNAKPDELDRDLKDHWTLKDNGKKVNVEAHSIEENVCTICGSEIWVFEDGFAEINNYNEYGDWTRITSYDADGTILSDISFEMEYDDNGTKLWQKQYYDGVIVEEVTYTLDDNGNVIPLKQINYSEDGERGEIVFDEYSNVIGQATFDFEGNLIYQEDNEYTYTNSGDYYISKQTMVWADGSKLISGFNQYQDTVLWTEYDSEGNLLFENTANYEYDTNGNMIRAEQYTDGVLMSISEYAMDANGESYVAKEIVNTEDGFYLEFIFDISGDVLEEHVCDAEGNRIEE